MSKTIAGHEKDEIDGKNNARDIQEIPEPFTVDTAANNIRHMSNSDAKTIPFIAMTANAFDDDMEKSKAAGMNAHLAKPINLRGCIRSSTTLF